MLIVYDIVDNSPGSMVLFYDHRTVHMDKQAFIVGLVGVLVIGGGVLLLTRPSGTKTDTVLSSLDRESTAQTEATPTTTMTNPPAMQIDPAKTYAATLKTSEGVIVIHLSAKATPITVNNFVSLARSGFYDGTVFHRVIKDFMIQGGDPKGNGTGGPGYQFDDESFEGEYTRGTVAMANAGPNTNGSQFFIMHADYALPKNYVIFGSVSSGIDVVDKIAEANVTSGMSGEPSTPVVPVRVESVKIEEK